MLVESLLKTPPMKKTFLKQKGHIGHSKWHPLMSDYLLGQRGNTFVFHGDITYHHLYQALKFVFLS